MTLLTHGLHHGRTDTSTTDIKAIRKAQSMCSGELKTCKNKESWDTRQPFPVSDVHVQRHSCVLIQEKHTLTVSYCEHCQCPLSI